MNQIALSVAPKPARLLPLVSALALAACTTPANAFPARGYGLIPPVSNLSCPLGALFVGPAGFGDGCAAARANGSLPAIGRAEYFSTDYARQSGQGPYPVLPSWNIAGVDTGFNLGRDTSLTMLDPAAPGAPLPPGCAFYRNGAPGYTDTPHAVPTVMCQATANGMTLALDRTTGPWDFTGASSANDGQPNPPTQGIWLLFKDSTYACTVSIQDDAFGMGANLYGSGGQGALNPVYFAAATNLAGCATTISHDDWNGQYPNAGDVTPRNVDFIKYGWFNSVVAEYNAFHASGARAFNGVTGPYAPYSFTWMYNYGGPTTVGGYGLCMTCGGLNYHGEFWQITPPPNVGMPVIHTDFNTLLMPANSKSGSWATPFFLAAAQGYGNPASLIDETNNTLVMNACAGAGCAGANVSGVALTYLRYQSYATIMVEQNFVDPTATYQCARAEGSVIGINAALNGAAVTISNWTGPNGYTTYPIQVGGTLYANDGSIANPTVILSQSSGPAGGAGVYVGSVDEGATTINTTAGQITPAYSSFLFPSTGPLVNVNLTDGSTIIPDGYLLYNGPNYQCRKPYG